MQLGDFPRAHGGITGVAKGYCACFAIESFGLRSFHEGPQLRLEAVSCRGLLFR